MIVLGSNSDVAQAFVEKCLSAGERYEKIYLLSSNTEEAKRFAQHIDVKYLQASEVLELDLLQKTNFHALENIHSNLLFCATGYLGKSVEEGWQDEQNTEKIITINFAKLVPILNFFAQKMINKRGGTMIVLSSVAGERGRQSNFIYGASKAAITQYLSGLRNFLCTKKVHVMTVKPGFMDTKMTEGMLLNPLLTASPKQAAECIYKGYKRKKNTIFVLPIWRWIMFVIRNIPEFIFKKMKL